MKTNITVIVLVIAVIAIVGFMMFKPKNTVVQQTQGSVHTSTGTIWDVLGNALDFFGSSTPADDAAGAAGGAAGAAAGAAA